MPIRERRGDADFTIDDSEQIHGPTRKYNRTHDADDVGCNFLFQGDCARC